MPSDQTASVSMEELRELIAEELELPVEDVTDEADLAADLEVDSLTAMEIAVQLEKKYHIKIADEEIKSLSSLVNIHRLVSAKVETA
jgi:acyl carrier protein